MIGHSLGGHNALFLAVFDERVKAVVSSCGFNVFAKHNKGDVRAWSSRSYMPRIKTVYKDDPKKRDQETTALLENLRRPRASWTAVVDHIEHVMKIAGARAVGLGTDYDGIEDPPDGLEDVSKLPALTEELLRRGHSEEEVRGVLGENFLGFWERADAARGNAPPGKEPMPFSKP